MVKRGLASPQTPFSRTPKKPVFVTCHKSPIGGVVVPPYGLSTPETPYKFQQKPTKTNVFQHFAIKAPTVSIVVKTSTRFLTSSKGKVTATISSRPPAAVICSADNSVSPLYHFYSLQQSSTPTHVFTA